MTNKEPVIGEKYMIGDSEDASFSFEPEMYVGKVMGVHLFKDDDGDYTDWKYWKPVTTEEVEEKIEKLEDEIIGDLVKPLSRSDRKINQIIDYINNQ